MQVVQFIFLLKNITSRYGAIKDACPIFYACLWASVSVRSCYVKIRLNMFCSNLEITQFHCHFFDYS